MWGSGKIALLPPQIRAEFAWLLALADPWGSFEFDPRGIWTRCYVFARPEISAEDVDRCLRAFHRGGLLFLWRQDGRVYAHWVAIDKPGRLPRPSERRDGQRLAPPVPIAELAAYIASYGQARQQLLLPPDDSSLIPTVASPTRRLTAPAEAPQQSRVNAAEPPQTGGVGVGLGSGLGLVGVRGGNGPPPPLETKTIPETERTPRQLADLAWIALTWWAQVPGGEEEAQRAWTERVATLKPAGAFEAALAAVGGSETVYEKYRSRKLDFLHRTFIDSFMTACETAATYAGGKP
jgi:hypothetical protein